MSIIYVLIPIAMLFVLIAVGVFFWAVKSDQFDDLERTVCRFCLMRNLWTTRRNRSNLKRLKLKSLKRLRIEAMEYTSPAPFWWA